MSEIKLHKRVKYASDVFNALVEKCEFPPEVAADFLNSIPDADVVKKEDVEHILERLEYYAESNEVTADRLNGITSKRLVRAWKERADAFRKAVRIIREEVG